MRPVSMPESLGRLRRVRHLGDGDLASVWLYHDDEAGTDVAVKALAGEWARRPEVKQRFVEEARILREATAEHVVAVHDLGESPDGRPYVVMTYADQGTVADLLPHAPIDRVAVDHLLKQACEGVANLHRVGLVHRDLKPSNLLICSDDRGGQRVLVSDLGLVKATLYASGLAETPGDPRYVAPEQGVPGGEVDERADVHALGAIAYHLLSGRPVREAPVRDIASATEPPLVSEIADVPYTVANVVRGAVQPDPAERTPDPGLLADGLGVTVALLQMAADRGLDTDRMRTPEEMREAQRAIRAAESEALAAAVEEPRMSWFQRRMIKIAVVTVLGLVVVGISELVGGDSEDDPSGRTSDLPSLPTLPPAADSPYCVSLIMNWGPATTLASVDIDRGMAADAIRDSRQAAPRAIEATWAQVDKPLRRAEALLDGAGASWVDLTAAGPGDDPSLRDARRALETAVDRFGKARTVVERHARSSCGLDLDGYAYEPR